MPDFDFFVQALKAHKVGGRFLFSCPLASHGKGNGDRNPSVELIDHNPHPPGVCCYGGCDNSKVWSASIRPYLDPDATLPPPNPALQKSGRLIPFIPAWQAPVPGFILRLAEWHQWTLTTPMPWERFGYELEDGSLACCVIRFNMADGGKEVRACRWDGLAWTWKTTGYGPAPLYNLRALLERPKAAALVVEGEKAARAAMRIPLLENYVAVCPWGGSSVRPTDWSPLEGRQVFVLPDNDQAGEKFAQRVGKHLKKAKAARISIIHPQRVYKRLDQPGECPIGWDIADIEN